jgi:PhnB protein
VRPSTINPYLAFNGNAREAMEFYAGVLGGKLDIQTIGEAGQAMPGADENNVMHAQLEAGEIVLMASDSMPGREAKTGTNVSLSLQGTDAAELKKAFDLLAEGGTVMLPLEEQFWGDTFGMLTDRFGIQWMVNIAKE